MLNELLMMNLPASSSSFSKVDNIPNKKYAFPVRMRIKTDIRKLWYKKYYFLLFPQKSSKMRICI